MDGARRSGTGAPVDSGGVGAARRGEGTPGKQTLTMALEAAHPTVGGPAPATGLPATGLPATGLPATGLPATGLPATGLAAQMGPSQPLDGAAARRGAKPDPVKKAALEVAEHAAKEVAESTREKVRDRLYAEISAPNKVIARERRAKQRPDLTGLGAVSQIDDLVARFRVIMASSWGTLKTGPERANAMLVLAEDKLMSLGVPQFSPFDLKDMQPKGAFSSEAWRFVFQKKMMETTAPTQDEQADLINMVAHESRHAEQAYLAARIAAGKGMKPAEIAAAVHISPRVAALAHDRKITAKTATGPELAFANAMFEAEATHRTKNLDIEAVVATRRNELNAANARCAACVATLRAHPNTTNMLETVQAREEMRAAVAAYSKAYRDYRNIPFEADAHQVGDTAALAFRENP
jgi:hypothetical protein